MCWEFFCGLFEHRDLSISSDFRDAIDIFDDFKPLDEVVADVGKSSWVHKMKEKTYIFHSRYPVWLWDTSGSICWVQTDETISNMQYY